MEPGLPASSYALFRRCRSYASGDVVIVDHPRFGKIVKRISAISAHELRLEGTHPSSVSGETMGALPPKRVLGRLVWSAAPPVPQSLSD